MINIRTHPSTVEFGELECCALRKATAEEDLQPFIEASLASIRATNPPYQVSVLSEIFLNTTRLVFMPREIHQSFYFGLASRERKLIEKREDVNLDCGHSAQQHQKALTMICAKMACPQGQN